MSKAKELAREMLDEATDMRYKGHATIEFFDKVEELIDAVLSEPEPELKGWIQVTDMDSRQILISLNASIVVMTSDSKTIIQFPSSASEYHIYDLVVKESYDEIKQLIKESQ
jgi:hypothetical protein